MLSWCRAGVSRLVRTRRLRALRTRGEVYHVPASAPRDPKLEVESPPRPAACPRVWRDLLSATISLHAMPASRSLFSV